MGKWTLWMWSYGKPEVAAVAAWSSFQAIFPQAERRWKSMKKRKNGWSGALKLLHSSLRADSNAWTSFWCGQQECDKATAVMITSWPQIWMATLEMASMILKAQHLYIYWCYLRTWLSRWEFPQRVISSHRFIWLALAKESWCWTNCSLNLEQQVTPTPKRWKIQKALQLFACCPSPGQWNG